MDRELRRHVAALLDGGHAHATFDQAVANLAPELRGRKPEAGTEAGPYTAWQLLEHLRIAQWDILEFSRTPGHISPEWPSGYWPATAKPPDPRSWARSVQSFRADLQAMKNLVLDPATDLFAVIAHGQGQTILREALLVADHNAYHIGQLVLLPKLLGAWKE
ncbi:MAG: DinB family protein [Acidobacteria bacterium]|nr:DinB family protein [Acidobacteriota bacterium]